MTIQVSPIVGSRADLSVLARSSYAAAKQDRSGVFFNQRKTMKKEQIEVYHPASKAAREAEYERRLNIVQALPGRVCNATSKALYVTPVWPSARVSAADSIKAKGQSC